MTKLITELHQECKEMISICCSEYGKIALKKSKGHPWFSSRKLLDFRLKKEGLGGYPNTSWTSPLFAVAVSDDTSEGGERSNWGDALFPNSQKTFVALTCGTRSTGHQSLPRGHGVRSSLWLPAWLEAAMTGASCCRSLEALYPEAESITR